MQEYHYSKSNSYAYIAMLIGQFMGNLDVQIVASSINQIQASLDVTAYEISWMQTAYLIAVVIMIPMTSWLTKLMSTRLLYVISCSCFALASICCAFSWNLYSMIIFRIIQGLCGGAMVPLVFSSLYRIFPPDLQVKYGIIAGLVATLSPTLGPTIGGFITESFSWRWIFLINVIPGIVTTIAVYKLLDIDKADWSLIRHFDLFAISLMIISLGALEYVLKEGGNYDWFASSYIIFLTIISLICFCMFIIRQYYQTIPIVDFRAFSNRNFAIGCLISFATGIGLYGAIYLLPLILAVIRNYNSWQIGIIMSVTGIVQFITSPIIALMSRKIDLRFILAFGLALLGSSFILNNDMSLNLSFKELFWPQVTRAIGIACCFISLTNITMSKLLPEQIPNASGLYNVMRNLGGAIGIAIIILLLQQQTNFHLKDMMAHLQPDIEIKQELATTEIELDAYIADKYRLKQAKLQLIYNAKLKDADLAAFNDVCTYIGIYLLFWLAAIPFIHGMTSSSHTPTKHHYVIDYIKAHMHIHLPHLPHLHHHK